MSLRKVSIGVFFLAVFAFGSVAAIAQSQIGGVVFKKGELGDRVPVEGITVDCYRTDSKLGCRSAKTDKEGRFTILGLPFQATIILGVSGPGYAPTVVTEKKAGEIKIEIEVTEGDGTVASEEDVRAVASNAITGDLTEAQKKEAAEIEAKIKEVDNANKKKIADNAAWDRALSEGLKAYNADDFDTAIARFTEGYDVDPNYASNASMFLNNIARSYYKRAAATYNSAIPTKTTNAVKPQVAKDFLVSLTKAIDAYEIATNTTPAFSEANNTRIASEKIVKDTFKIMGQMKLNLVAYLNSGEDNAAAVDIFKTAYKLMPKDDDILSGLIFTLSNIGFATEPFDKAVLQDCINYADHYMKNAKADHTGREAVEGTLSTLQSMGYKPKPLN